MSDRDTYLLESLHSKIDAIAKATAEHMMADGVEPSADLLKQWDRAFRPFDFWKELDG